MAKGSKMKLFSFLVVIVFLLIFLSIFFKNGKLQNIIFDVASIPEKAFFLIGDIFSSGFKIIFSLKNVVIENSSLRLENDTLVQKLVDFEKVKSENILLREQLSLSLTKSYNLLDVKITSFEPSNLFEFLIINKGKNDGLEKDMPVILTGNILVGKITDVYDDYSKVMLITDSNNKVNVISFSNQEDIESQNRSYSGVLSGYFGKSIFMDLIEKSSLVNQKDMIITSGLDGIYPENLIVGYVDVIKDDDNAVFKQAYLNPAFLPLDSTLAFVIR
ncbi:MAG: rod shape-determining protein MreC [Patescibacteria group bacterium]